MQESALYEIRVSKNRKQDPMLCELLSTTLFDKKGRDNYTKLTNDKENQQQVVNRVKDSKRSPTESMYINDPANKQLKTGKYSIYVFIYIFSI